MAGQGRVVHFDVEGEILVQPVVAQESDDCLGIHIVLMLSRFHRFRLDEEGTLETVLATVVAGHHQHHGEMLFLAFHVGVEQRHVALATAPEDVVLAAQGDACVDGVLDLRGRERRDVEVGVGGRAVHVAFVPEDVGRGPEKLLARSLLQPFGVLHHRGQPFLELRQRVARFHHVHIVEAVVGDGAFGHELESGVHLVFGAGNGVGGGVPRKGLRRTAELIDSVGAERVPVGHGELEMLLHGLAHHHAVLVIIVEG